jgi:hypothetical protein
MSLQNQQIVSAQVVLRPASGKPIDGQTAITAANIKEYVPSAEAVARAQRAFKAAGFDVGPVMGNSFPITAPASTFERVFQTRLRRQEPGGVEAVSDDGSARYELPRQGLSPEIESLVLAVTFTPPPDFGPTRFGP